MAELFKMKLLDVNKNQILPETSADQVTMAGGGNVEAKIKSLESAFAAGTRLLGTVGTEGTVETLPADSYQLGDMYVVKTAGTYASQVCEPGDLILCVKAYAEEGAADTDWTVIQNNVVRAVKGPESATDGNLMAFDGASGTVAKDSSLKMTDQVRQGLHRRLRRRCGRPLLFRQLDVQSRCGSGHDPERLCYLRGQRYRSADRGRLGVRC